MNMDMYQVIHLSDLPKVIAIDPSDDYSKFMILDRAKSLGYAVKHLEAHEIPCLGYYSLDNVEESKDLFIVNKALSDDIPKILAFLRNGSGVLVVSIPSVTLRSKGASLLSTSDGFCKAEKQEIKPWEVESFITTRLGEMGIKTEKGAIEELANRIGTSMVRFEVEVQKLLLYDHSGISLLAIKTLVRDDSLDDLYSAIDKLIKGDVTQFFSRVRLSKQPLMAVRGLLSEADKIARIAMFQAIGMDNQAIQEATGIKAFVISNKYSPAVKSLGKAKALALVSKLTDLEDKILTPGLKVDPWILLESSVCEVLSNGKQHKS